jgi:GGDEF domain-containing protein
VSSDVDAVADRILRAFDEPVDADGIGVTIGVSVGLAVLYPNTAAGAESLLAAADEAMYRAKAAGRGRIERIDIPH